MEQNLLSPHAQPPHVNPLRVLDLSVLKIQSADSHFRPQLIKNLRQEILQLLPNLEMSEERKSYFLHMVMQSHDLNSLQEIVNEIN